MCQAAIASALSDGEGLRAKYGFQHESAARMTDKIRTSLLHYGGASVVAAVAICLGWLLGPWMGPALPLSTLYGAVAFAGFWGGYRPAIFITILGYLACDWLRIDLGGLRGHFGDDPAFSILGLGFYLLFCSVIIGCGESMRQARRSAAARQCQLEQELERQKQSQQLLASFLQSSPLGIGLLDKEMRYLAVNPALAEIDGISTEGHLGKSVLEVAPGLSATAASVFQKVVKTGEAVLGIEFTGKRVEATGTQRFWEESWFPLFNQAGQLAGAAIIVQERTERRHDENVLREITQQFQIITDSMPALAARCSRDLRYIWVSKSYADWVGRPAGEIVDRPIVDILGAEALARIRPYIEKVLAGQVVRYEQQVPFKGIGVRWISAAYTPTRDAHGVCDGWVAVVDDIEDRRRVEQALRESEGRFRRVFDCNMVPMGTWTWDGGILEANDALLELIGYGREALRAGKLRWRDLTPADHFDRDEQALAQIRERGVCTPFEKVFLHKDGRRIPILIAGASFEDTSQSGVFFALDLTSRNQVEQELRRLNQELREADRRKDAFLATLAHELRNPLAPIRTAADIFRVKAPDIPELLWASGVIERQVAQMARLLEDLLDVSRITRNKLELRKSRVTLAQVVESAVETSRPLIDGGGHELTVTLPSQPVYLDADPVRLAQVFSNLLNNAAKYTERAGRIQLTAEQCGSEIVVSVRDTGIGISKEMLPRLFEMFSQAKPAIERAQGGLGIGLSLVRGLVEMHGGTVEAHSDGPGTGSEFVVKLPIVVGLQAPG